MNITIFTFNAFQENTYLVYDDDGIAAIFDPGCNSADEQKTLENFISENNLTVQHLINTHCHIDHVLGNNFVAKKYALQLTSSKGEQQVLDLQTQTANMYGIAYDPSPKITQFLAEGDVLKIGSIELDVISCPGHSPDHIVFHHKPSKQIIGGDVLFRDSIGRTDLPGGNHEVLIYNIKTKLLTLDKDTVVYPGHGPQTTIGYEKVNNYFVGSNSKA